MQHAPIAPFLDSLSRPDGRPIALLFAEDGAALADSLAHLRGLGFGQIGLFAPPGLALPDLPPDTRPPHRIDWQPSRPGALNEAVTQVIAAAPGQWLHYCYNAEYLYYPFCESRSIRDLVSFLAEERRHSVLTYVVDLYPGDLTRYPDGLCPRDEAMFDRSGYYALARPDLAGNGHPKERQLDFHGGLRWRFEEHIPPARRRIDRIGLFRAEPGLRLLDDHRLNKEEFNTYACPWHNSVTAAICSFRTAKALRGNPGSREGIDSFLWRESLAFDGRSQQLMELGLMEPGQWF